MIEKKHIIIIGAGASGLAAACAAAASGARVTVLEKNHVPGRKVLSTGAGKCNLTNALVTAARYHGGEAPFVNRVLKALPPGYVNSFFKDLGLLTVQDPDGRIFPRSMKAADVVAVLVNCANWKNAEIRLLTEALAVKKSADGFEVSVRSVSPKWEKGAAAGPETTLICDKVILAAGGPAYPQIGGSVSGYDLARSLGHSIKTPEPVLVPLKVRESFITQVEGIRVQAALELNSGGRMLARGRGEVLFTKYGLSGPAVLELSRAAVFALKSGPVKCRLDFFPEYTASALRALLLARRAEMADRFWRMFLCGLADARLLQLLSDLAKVGADKLVGAVPEKTFEDFMRLLNGFELELSGPLAFEDAMAAAGGVETTEVSPESFESKKVKGLFLAGELLDIDADSGGYNLHFAWTSGLLAGRAASG
ncbi:MAG: aminoacetone oxidase family FAD-binding enzyme [Elusimicrobiales bacterium]